MGIGEKPKSEAEALRRAVDQITDLLPQGWRWQLMQNPRLLPEPDIDGLLEVYGPDQTLATLAVEARLSIDGRDVDRLQRLQGEIQLTNADLDKARLLVAAPYISKPVRTRLQQAGLSYVDLTGNVRLSLSKPGLFLMNRGADADPWRGPGRPLGTLKGEPAAKVVRTLVDFRTSWPIRQLMETAGASTGSTYRVVGYLEQLGLVSREPDKKVRVRDWVGLLRAWSADYVLTRDNSTTRWIAARGLPDFLARLSEATSAGEEAFRYAVTGTVAAANWAAYAPASFVTAYASDPNVLAEALELRPAETGANVLLAEPAFGIVFVRSWLNDAGIKTAAPAQVVVDLLTGPGRSPAEADKLLEWMQRNESDWRAP